MKTGIQAKNDTEPTGLPQENLSGGSNEKEIDQEREGAKGPKKKKEEDASYRVSTDGGNFRRETTSCSFKENFVARGKKIIVGKFFRKLFRRGDVLVTGQEKKSRYEKGVAEDLQRGEGKTLPNSL